MRGDASFGTPSLPRVGRGLQAILLLLGALWLAFTLALTWAGASERVFLLFTWSDAAILRGEVWRIFTAPLLLVPSSVSGLIFGLLGLYFLGTSLEEHFGTRRFLSFLAISAVVPYFVQSALALLLPERIVTTLVPPFSFGPWPAIQAIAVAWACSFRGRTVQLFMVIPVTSRTLLLFVVGASVLSAIAASQVPSGHFASFAGLGMGWLLGGDTPSPLRRLWLKRRLKALDREVERERAERQNRVRGAHLRVVPPPTKSDRSLH